MNNKFFRFSTIALTAAVMAFSVSCKDDEEDPTLSVSPSTSAVVFKANGTSDAATTFTVTTNQKEWSVNVSPATQTWLTVTETGNTFTLTAGEAGTTAPPEVTLTVTAGKATSVSIKVTQQATPLYLNVTPSDPFIVVNAAGDEAVSGSLVYTVETNNPGGFVVTASQPWINRTLTPTGFSFTADPGQPLERTATITVTVGGGVEAGGLTVTLNVTQLAKFGEITADVLKNYQAPFNIVGEEPVWWFYSEDPSTDMGAYKIADWKTNTEGGKNGNVFKGAEGSEMDYIMSMSAWDADFYPGATITNGKLYQTFDLDAGNYSVSVVIHLYSYANSFLAVAVGEDLPNIADLEEQSLNYVLVPEFYAGPGNLDFEFSMNFTLTEKSTVSLGFVANCMDNEFFIKEIALFRED